MKHLWRLSSGFAVLAVVLAVAIVSAYYPAVLIGIGATALAYLFGTAVTERP